MTKPPTPTSPFKTIVLLLLFFCGFLIVAEMGLQIIHLTALVASDPEQFINQERLKQVSVSRKIDDPVLGHRPNPEYNEHDENGFRNARVPQAGKVDIVAIGDSQTYGTNAHRPEAWPQQLAKITGFTTYNMAFGGYSPLHHSFLLDEALAFKPRLVIAGVYFGNDFLEAFLLGYGENHIARFGSKNTEVRGRVTALEKDSPVSATVKKYSNDSNHMLIYSQSGARDWLAQHSQLYKIFTSIQNWVAGKLFDPKQCLDPVWPHWHPPDTAAPTVLTPRYRWVTVNAKDPRVHEGLRIAQEALLEMKNRTKEAGVEFLVVLIPTKERVYEELVNANKGSTIFNQLVVDEEVLEKGLVQFFERERIRYLPLLPSLKLALWSGLAPYPNNSDGHPNGTGYQVLSECIAAYLKHEKLLG